MNIKRNIFIAGLAALTLISIMLFCSCKNESPASPEEDNKLYIYRLDGDNAVITGYSGTSETLNIPSSLDGHTVTEIDKGAFYNFVYLKEVTVPDSVKTIEKAFEKCEYLTAVDIGSGVTNANSAFALCTALTKVTGGENITDMSEMFVGCSSLKRAEIPASCEKCDYTFKDCTKLKSVSLQGNPQSLDFTFENCKSLTEIKIPSGVKKLTNTFSGCEQLSKISGGETVSEYENSFCDCVSLKEITLGKKVGSLKNVFTNCAALEKIDNLPKQVTYYTPSFNGCTKLKNAVIPTIADTECASGYSISNDLNQCHSITSLTVNQVFDIGDDFCTYFSEYTALEELNIPEEMYPSFLSPSFDYTDDLCYDYGEDVAAALQKAVSARSIRINDNYGTVDGVNYTHVYGCDVGKVDTKTIINTCDVNGFKPFTESSYWCGYAEGGNRIEETQVIKRTYSFFLRTTGENSGSLPEKIKINGMECRVGK